MLQFQTFITPIINSISLHHMHNSKNLINKNLNQQKKVWAKINNFDVDAAAFCAMEMKVNQWLKRHYKDAGPQQSKRVKFSDLLDEATTQLSPVAVTNIALAKAIRDEFPTATSKKAGDRRHTYVYGIEKASTGTVELDRALRRNEQLEQQLHELQQRVVQLEKEKESAAASQKLELDGQMQTLLNPNMLAYHGPDTVEHLHGFSLESLIEEFAENAPDVMDLVRHLGNCGRYEGDDDDNDENLSTATQRTVTSLCTLLKCRSAKVLGLQLLLSIMLIARATNKQVRTINENKM